MKYIRVLILASLSFGLLSACLSLPKSEPDVQASYSHTQLREGKHYLAYSGELAMTLEVATEKWLAKAEKLCKSREIDYEIQKQELRGKDFSEEKFPYVEGSIFCPNDSE